MPDWRGGDGGLGGGGGAIFSEPCKQVEIYWSTLFDNEAGQGGEAGQDCCDNDGTGGHGGIGGGIVVQGRLVLEDSTVEGNRAGNGAEPSNGDRVRPGGDGGDGGGLAVLSGSIEIRRSTIAWNLGGAPGYGGEAASTGNYCTPADGGGIWASLSSTVESFIESSTVSSNRANAEEACNGSGEGGGLFLASGRVTLKNATFTDNWPGVGLRTDLCLLGDRGFGSAVYNEGGTVTLSNSLLGTVYWNGNALAEICAGSGDYEDGTPSHNIAFSNGWYNGCHGAFLGSDPLLGTLPQNPTTGDGNTPGNAPPHFVPGEGSPAIDGGENGQPCVSLDIRRLSRPRGPACDIGAYEVDHGHVLEDPDDVRTHLHDRLG